MKKEIKVFGFWILVITLLISISFVEGVVDEPETITPNEFPDTPIITGQEDVYSSSKIIYNQEGNIIKEDETMQYKGYIIQFQDNPILEVKTKLDKQAKKNKEYVERAPIYSPKRIYIQQFRVMPEDVDNKIKQYSKNLKTKKKSAKNKVLTRINNKRNPDTGLTGNIIKNIFSKITGKAVYDSKFEEELVLGEFENTFNGIALDITDEEAKEIKNLPEVKSVSPNLEVKATLMDSVPLINADDLWLLDEDGNKCAETGKQCLTGEGVTIAIIDTGIDYTHPDLGSCFGTACKVIGGYDFINNNEDPIDDHGHGTHVAGIAAGNGTLKGVAPNAKLYAYKVLDYRGRGNFANVMRAIDRAVDPNQDGDFSDKIDVISMSLGAPGYYYCDDSSLISITNAISAGVNVVIAAGNEGGENTIEYPGCHKDAITVGSSEKNNYIISSFSSRGFGLYNGKPILKPDIVAPGGYICSAQFGNIYSYYECYDDKHIKLSGTSMATPHVTGAIALLKQAFPEINSYETKSLIMNRANSSYFPYYRNYNNFDTGNGLIDVFQSFNSYKNDRLIINPGSVSFGVFDLSQDIWQKNETIKIINNADLDYSLDISIEGDFPARISFTFPQSLVSEAGSEQTFDFKITADNNIEDGEYLGNLLINYNSKTIKLPFFFKKFHLKVDTDKEITNSDIEIGMTSEIPVNIFESYLIKPDFTRENINLERVDSYFKSYKIDYVPDSEGEYKIFVRASDFYGNTLYGESNFTSDFTSPKLSLDINELGEITLNSDEEIGKYWLTEEINVDDADNEQIEHSTIVKDREEEIFINYVWSGPSGFYTPYKIYNLEYNRNKNQLINKKIVVDGTRLHDKLYDEYNRTYLGYALWLDHEPILLSDSNNNLYTLFKFETNNVFCGVVGIGLAKLNKETNNWTILRDDLNRIDVCTDNETMCVKPSLYREHWCRPDENGKFEKDIFNFKAKMDKNNNIHLIWKETNDGEIVEGTIYYHYLLYHMIIDTNGNVVVDKSPIVYLSNPNRVSNYYFDFDFDFDSQNNLYLFWSESVTDGTYRDEFKTYYKRLNQNIGSWSNIVEVTTPYVYLYKIGIGKDDKIHFMYNPDYNTNTGDVDYGFLNQDNSIQFVRKIKDTGGSNKGGSFIVDEDNNLYFSHEEFVYNSYSKYLGLIYDIFKSKKNSWEEGNLFTEDNSYNRMESNSIIIDDLNNYLTTFVSDIDIFVGRSSINLLRFDTLLLRRYTNNPFVRITKPDLTKEIIELDYSEDKWIGKFEFNSSKDYLIEAFGTDKAGNIGNTSSIYSGEKLPLNPAWDIDGNKLINSSTDGTLVIRYLFGFRGDTLVQGAIGENAIRTTADEIENYLKHLKENGFLDVDGNGNNDALSDGTMIARYMERVEGEDLIKDAIGSNATRTTPEEIINFLNSATKPPSTLTNNAQTSVTGILKLILQKNVSGIWRDQNIVYNRQKTLAPLETINLATLWNSLNISAGSAGQYRVLARFESGINMQESNYEFNIE